MSKKPFNEVLADELDRQARLVIIELDINFFRPHQEFMQLAETAMNLRTNADKLRKLSEEVK